MNRGKGSNEELNERVSIAVLAIVVVGAISFLVFAKLKKK